MLCFGEVILVLTFVQAKDINDNIDELRKDYHIRY